MAPTLLEAKSGWLHATQEPSIFKWKGISLRLSVIMFWSWLLCIIFEKKKGNIVKGLYILTLIGYYPKLLT